MNRKESTLPKTPSGRDVSIDIARGIGIVAVVVGHLTPWAYDAIYVFHMPLFFILGPPLLLAVGVVLPLAVHRIVSGVPALAFVFLGRRSAALSHG